MEQTDKKPKPKIVKKPPDMFAFKKLPTARPRINKRANEIINISTL